MRKNWSNALITGSLLLLLGTALILAPGTARAQGYSVGLGGHEYTVAPGSATTGTIRISNMLNEELKLTLYTGDLERAPELAGEYRFVVGEGDEERTLMPWLTCNETELSLGPGEVRNINYYINLPADPEMSGSYWGVIYVERAPTEEEIEELLSEEEQESIGIGIRNVFRFAVRIIATVQGTEELGGKLANIGVQPVEGGGFNVITTFENTGNTWLRPQVWLELRDLTGETVYYNEGIEKTVLPESQLNFELMVRGLDIPLGQYLLLVVADYGSPKLVAGQAQLEITEEMLGGELPEHLQPPTETFEDTPPDE